MPLNPSQIVDRLSADASFAAGVTNWRVAPACEARTAPFPEGVNPRIDHMGHLDLLHSARRLWGQSPLPPTGSP